MIGAGSAYSKGTGKWFAENIKRLMDSGLTTEEAKIAAMYIYYNYYDLSDINTVAWSYLITATQYALKEAGLPVTVRVGITSATDNYLKRLFAPQDWKTISFDKIIQTIQEKRHTLQEDLIKKPQPVYQKKFIFGSWKNIAIAVGALIAVKVLL